MKFFVKDCAVMQDICLVEKNYDVVELSSSFQSLMFQFRYEDIKSST